MLSLTLKKARVSRATLLRLVSAIGSSAVFGMLAAPVTQALYWPSAFVLAFAYGFFFVGGTGYRILVAVAFQDASRKASASWSGATAASVLAALAAAVLLARWDGEASLLLAAYAVAINVAYVPVKFACLEAGCCHAQRRDSFLIRDHDLRHVEIAASAAVIATTLSAMWIGAVGVAAIAGIGGHLAIRLLSRWSRDRLPGYGPEAEVKGQELVPLAVAFTAALWMAASA